MWRIASKLIMQGTHMQFWGECARGDGQVIEVTDKGRDFGRDSDSRKRR